MTTPSRTSFLVLLVEDDPHDAELIAQAFDGLRVPIEAHRVATVEEVDAYLNDVVANRAVRPDLVILDLKLPGQSGFTVLERLKRDEQLGVVPVLVLTGSDHERDVWGSYQQYANAYVVKPGTSEAFARTLRLLAEFYLNVAVLPPDRPPGRGPRG